MHKLQTRYILHCEKSLNYQQKALNKEALESHKMYFFIDVPGGCGKTFTANTIANSIGLHKTQFLASTRVAAVNLPGGKTAHPYFGIPVQNIGIHSISKHSGDQGILNEMKKIELFIWDEVSMMHIHQVNVVDELLQRLHSNTLPFGGCKMLLMGDFRQMLPIIPGGTRKDVYNCLIKQHVTWKNFIKLSLSINVRNDNDSWSSYLTRIGNGEESKCENKTTMDSKILLVGTFEELVIHTFKDSVDYKEEVILTTRNDSCRKIHYHILDNLPGESREYICFTRYIETTKRVRGINDEYLNTCSSPQIPDYIITLKVGAIIKLTVNLNPAMCLKNGTKLKVLHV